MQLSKRLYAVASLVTPGNRVADVGCDHAYTSIYLAEQGISYRIIAMDVNQGPIDRAKENIVKYGYEDIIEIRKSDGLQKLNPSETDTILIAGMGGALTTQILQERLEVVNEVRELILQPQSEINKVRRMLIETGFIIIKENMIKEDGKYYVMMKAIPREGVSELDAFTLVQEVHFYYGRLLLEQKHPVLQAFLNWELELCENILQTLVAEQMDNAKSRQKEIEDKIGLIHCGLEYYK